MRLDRNDEIDSGCVFKNESPSMMLEMGSSPMPDWNQDDRCTEEAVTWIRTPTGVRRYLCESHAAHLFRFDTDPEDIEDHPKGELCDGCAKPTLYSDLNHKRNCPDCSEEGR